MEQATSWTNGLNTWALRGGNEMLEADVAVIGSGNVAALRPAAETVVVERAEGEGQGSEWATALTLVEEACAALRASEERIEQLEAEADQRIQDSRGELEALQAQLRLAQREIERSYGQTAAAMARAAAAEAWLEKLGGTIVNSFGRLSPSAQQRAS